MDELEPSIPRAKKAKLECDPKHETLMEPDAFANLPVELLLMIFEYLNIYDRKDCMLVCKRWCEILQEPDFSKDMVFRFHSVYLDETCPPFSTFASSERALYSVSLSLKDYLYRAETLGAFIGLIGAKTQHLELEVVRENSFARINLKGFNVLESLKYKGPLSDFLFLSQYSAIPPSLREVEVSVVERFLSQSQMNQLRSLKQRMRITSSRVENVSSKFNEIVELFKVPYVPNLTSFSTIEPFDILKTDEIDLLNIDFEEKSFPAVAKIKGFPKEHLRLEDSNSFCFFSHMVLPFVTKKPSFAVNGRRCERCLDNALTSYASFKDVSLVNVSRQDISKIFSASRELRSIDVDKLFTRDLCYSSYIQNNTFGHLQTLKIKSLHIGRHNWPKIPSLTDITISTSTSSDIFYEVIKSSPNVRKFATNDEIDYDLFENMICGWPYLTSHESGFEAFAEEIHIQRENPVILLLQEHARNLRNFKTLDANQGNQAKFYSFVRQLFKHVPTLRKFSWQGTGSPFTYLDSQFDS